MGKGYWAGGGVVREWGKGVRQGRSGEGWVCQHRHEIGMPRVGYAFSFSIFLNKNYNL